MKFIRKLYDWVLSFADHPYGTWILFLIAFMESSFFPVPPDFLLIAMSVGSVKRSFWFALVCSAGSVLGAILGYLIGWHFYGLIGEPIINFYGLSEKYDQVRLLYENWNALAVGVAGFTPIPYKVFTIAAGAFKINFLTFILASIASRSARFFLVAGLIRLACPGIKTFIDRYFNILTVVATILLVGGFLVIKYLL
jgi:membrane protein YqaA with SNARE-associated domain